MDEKQMLASEQLVTLQDLRKKGMPDNQAKRTLRNAAEEEAERLQGQIGPFKLEDSEKLLYGLGQALKSNRDDLFDAYQTTIFYDTSAQTPTSQANAAAELASQTAKSNLEKTLASMAENSVVCEDTDPRNPPKVDNNAIANLNAELGRLSVESASVLAQTICCVDGRQTRIEQRQREMAKSVSGVLDTLQHLQSAAAGAATQMQRNRDAAADAMRKRKATAQRRSKSQKGSMMSSFFDWSPADAEAQLPPVAGSSVTSSGLRLVAIGNQ